MNTNNINQLLAKYWEAETSIQEEKTLGAYFKNGNVAPEHQQYSSLFGYYDAMSTLTSAKKANEIPVVEKRGIIRSLFTRNIMGIAASLLLLISVGTYIAQSSSPYHYKGKTTEITEEKEAFEMTKQALAYLSINLDKNSRKISNNLNKMEAVSILK